MFYFEIWKFSWCVLHSLGVSKFTYCIFSLFETMSIKMVLKISCYSYLKIVYSEGIPCLWFFKQSFFGRCSSCVLGTVRSLFGSFCTVSYDLYDSIVFVPCCTSQVKSRYSVRQFLHTEKVATIVKQSSKYGWNKLIVIISVWYLEYIGKLILNHLYVVFVGS